MIYYMVSVVGAQAPSKMHTDLEAAKTEAERLAMLSGNRHATIHVVEIVATLKPQTSHTWEQLK